jgi:hypothetical protein
MLLRDLQQTCSSAFMKLKGWQAFELMPDMCIGMCLHLFGRNSDVCGWEVHNGQKEIQKIPKNFARVVD